MRDVAIMDIAMNLARIGNWAADDFDKKEKRIKMFFEQTNVYLNDLDISAYSQSTQQALRRFSQVFNLFHKQIPSTPKDRLRWADTILTWSNILTHKAKLNLP